MKLFHQLSAEEQDNAVHYTIGIVVEDMLEDGPRFSPQTEAEADVLDKLIAGLEHAKSLKDFNEQVNFLLEDEDLSDLLHEIALEVSKTAFYHDGNELVIFSDQLQAPNHEHSVDEETVADKPRDPKIMN